MRDEHLTPVLMACSEAELALLIEFLGRPPSGLMWFDSRVREPGTPRADRVEAVVQRILWLGDHSFAGRLGAEKRAYLQVVCDALEDLHLPETPGDGIHALELRIVRHALDSEFERLSAPVREGLMARFYSGEFFRGGLRGVDLLDPLFTPEDDRRKVAPRKALRALGEAAGRQAAVQARRYAIKAGVRLLARRLAGPVGWAMSAWDWAGPAFRLTVPAICYVAYLRARQIAPATVESASVGAA